MTPSNLRIYFLHHQLISVSVLLHLYPVIMTEHNPNVLKIPLMMFSVNLLFHQSFKTNHTKSCSNGGAYKKDFYRKVLLKKKTKSPHKTHHHLFILNLFWEINNLNTSLWYSVTFIYFNHLLHFHIKSFFFFLSK